MISWSCLSGVVCLCRHRRLCVRCGLPQKQSTLVSWLNPLYTDAVSYFQHRFHSVTSSSQRSAVNGAALLLLFKCLIIIKVFVYFVIILPKKLLDKDSQFGECKLSLRFKICRHQKHHHLELPKSMCLRKCLILLSLFQMSISFWFKFQFV